MTIKVKKGEVYFPKYAGWWATSREDELKEWEGGKRTPRKDSGFRKAQLGDPELTAMNDMWVWRPDEVNEFGLVIP